MIINHYYIKIYHLPKYPTKPNMYKANRTKKCLHNENVVYDLNSVFSIRDNF